MDFVTDKPMELRSTQKTATSEFNLDATFIGVSTSIRSLMDQAKSVAEAGYGHVIINGPIGAGKSQLARFIHMHSPRCNRPIVFLDCGSMPSLSSELFGFRRGAFTGADRDYSGRLAVADGGTVVLEDMERLNHQEQDSLHRFVETGEYFRYGDSRLLHVDVRLLATTNKSLKTEVESGRLKEDFISRLDCFILRIPGLDERKEDLPILSEYLLKRNMTRLRSQGRTGGASITFDDSCWDFLNSVSFRDHVRGLDKLILRTLVIMGSKKIVTADDLAKAAGSHAPRSPRPGFVKSSSLNAVLEQTERDHIECIYRAAPTVTEAARSLGISRSALYEKLTRFGIARR
jgi:DNA-binding NtrC family response regulator